MFAKLGAVAFAARAKTKRDILEDRKFTKDLNNNSRINHLHFILFIKDCNIIIIKTNEDSIEKSKFLHF